MRRAPTTIFASLLTTTFATVILLSFLFPGPAQAGPQHRKVLLNGVDLAGVELPPSTFRDCTVTLDKAGNVHITAPGVKLQPATSSPAAKTTKSTKSTKTTKTTKTAKTAKTTKTTKTDARRSTKVPTKLSQHYFLVARQSPGGAARYDVTVYINGERITVLRSSSAQTATEITSHLRPGDNTIEFLAKKNGAKPGAADHYFEIQIAEGHVEHGNAVIESTVLRYRRTAAETASFRDYYRLRTR